MERIVKGIWIPIEIWEAEDLSWNEKILLMEIDSFTSKGKDCFISDDYIAELLNINTRNARKNLSSLVQKGYVKRTRFDGRRRYIESNLCQAGRSLETGQGGLERPTTYNNIPIDSYIHKNITNNKGTAKFDFLNALLEAGVSQQVAQDFMQVRKEKKATNSETAFKMLMNEISRSGRSADECIRVAVANSWKGFRVEWMQNLETPQGRPAPAPKRNNFTDMVSLGQKLGMFKQPTKKEVPDEQ